ncbi:DMT family transporter [Polymorphobacter multimanifer]|uniref:Drug/metabolite transporter (DMT)-like permease n=1 Tax=Polymorphobacter multimanifer TaxID=1070431 RepID=A0A841L2D5_9SPHN|nr:DMT family transporter [Polymorphobacter multimanifer]MBB6226476.1 drug/metabolite transporter (DMT)-like permease [Polymorphobacter multimanifer]
MASIASRPAGTQAAVWMVTSCVAFASMWVMIRYASASLHAFEIVFFRNALGLIVLLPMLLRTPGLLQLTRWRVHVRRATSGFIATMGTFYAVANAPLATALSINYTAPLFATIGAVLFLGERIRIRRVAALAAGFCGMLIVVRPGAVPLSAGVVAAVISAISTAFSVVAIRQLVGKDDSRAVAAWSFILLVIPSLIVAAFVWVWPPREVWPLLAGIGVMAAIGQLSVSKAFSLAEASAVLPFDFVRFALVTLAGVMLFGERYDLLTLGGGAIILASTIYLALREAKVARDARAASLPVRDS